MIQLTISGMTCESCATHVKEALESARGFIKIVAEREGGRTFRSNLPTSCGCPSSLALSHEDFIRQLARLA